MGVKVNGATLYPKNGKERNHKKTVPDLLSGTRVTMKASLFQSTPRKANLSVSLVFVGIAIHLGFPSAQTIVSYPPSNLVFQRNMVRAISTAHCINCFLNAVLDGIKSNQVFSCVISHKRNLAKRELKVKEAS